MSAITFVWNEMPVINGITNENFVRNALSAMTGRAPGTVDVLAQGRHAVFGFRKSRPLAKGPWQSDGIASRMIHGQQITLAISGFIDNAEDISGKFGQRDKPGASSVADLLIDLYLTNGRDFASEIGGSFSIVIRDERRDETLLVRDRFGIEPLYFWVGENGTKLIAASEPKAIIEDREFKRVFDESAITDLLNSTSRIPGTTVYRNLNEVRPSEVLTFRRGYLYSARYWSLPLSFCRPSDTEEVSSTLSDLLHQAVSRRVDTSRNAQAFLLSGGLDSSAICTLANRIAPDREGLRTFSFTYPEDEADFQSDALHITSDSPYVDIMARFLGSRHENIAITNVDFRLALEETVHARDLPGVGDLDVTLLQLFKGLRSRGYTEAFSGEGSDDTFGGYPWFHGEAVEPTRSFPWLKGTEASKFLNGGLLERIDVKDILRERWSAASSEQPYLRSVDRFQQHMDQVFYMEITRFLPFLLDRVDRMSAGAGIRVHLPFLDHRLIEYVWSLDYSRIKTVGGMEKGILRKALEDKLPSDITQRKKSGFAVTRNARYLSAIRDYLLEKVIHGDTATREIVNIEALKSILEGPSWFDGTFSAPPILPRIVLFDMWIRRYGAAFESVRDAG
ncbi:UNVERIFIED_ORG: asparagine synthase (glutamine-hydrolyzing) [Burkholderia contaminans]|nr:asparagine synthase (glutamine-hydrolyzing) [Burkholderia contaminans]